MRAEPLHYFYPVCRGSEHPDVGPVKDKEKEREREREREREGRKDQKIEVSAPMYSKDLVLVDADGLGQG